MCKGECGGYEQHCVDFDPIDLLPIRLTQETGISLKEHHPFLAGYTPDGRPSYVFWLRDQHDILHYGCGPTVREARFLRQLEVKGAFGLTGIVESDVAVFVLVLKYDVEAYDRCGLYADRYSKAGMDPTGPFSWKFVRKLPAALRDATA